MVWDQLSAWHNGGQYDYLKKVSAAYCWSKSRNIMKHPTSYSLEDKELLDPEVLPADTRVVKVGKMEKREKHWIDMVWKGK